MYSKYNFYFLFFSNLFKFIHYGNCPLPLPEDLGIGVRERERKRGREIRKEGKKGGREKRRKEKQNEIQTESRFTKDYRAAKWQS